MGQDPCEKGGAGRTDEEVADLLEEQLSLHGAVRDDRRNRAVTLLIASLRVSDAPSVGTGSGPAGAESPASTAPHTAKGPAIGREVWELVIASPDTPGPRGPDRYESYDDFRSAVGCYRPRHDPGWYGMQDHDEQAFIQDRKDKEMCGPVSLSHLGENRHLSIVTDKTWRL